MSRYDRPRVPAPLCEKKHHKPAGTMGNQSGAEPLDPDRAFVSTHVCARVECQDDAREWVYAHTREDGVFSTFEENRAAAAERDAAKGSAS